VSAFNWYSLPTFAVMLLFWLLAAYVLTRSPRSPASLAGVCASIAAATYLLGQGMGSNAETLGQWQSWARLSMLGAIFASLFWYGLTVVLLHDQRTQMGAFLRWVSYPAAIAVVLLTVASILALLHGDWLFLWVAVQAAKPITYTPYHLSGGSFYPVFSLLLLVSTVGSAANVFAGWRTADDEDVRHRFGWLLISAILFFFAANMLGIASANGEVGDWGIVPSHLLLGLAMLAMMWNVASYSLLVRGQVIRRDALYFLTSLGGICLAYAALFVILSGGLYSYRLLGMLIALLILAVLTHALIDVGRRALDHLFFSVEVQSLRSNLSVVVQDAALSPRFDEVLDEAHRELDAASRAHFLRITEEALRRVNAPSALARCDLMDRLPLTLSATSRSGGGTTLEQAQALRKILVESIERLKPEGASSNSPAALQYEILHEEYLEGLPNREILIRHSVSESTFHRNRREAIAAVARDMQERELRPVPTT
jgi:N-terminal 7TM region of histidine kinase